jgi:hypothetical protein
MQEIVSELKNQQRGLLTFYTDVWLENLGNTERDIQYRRQTTSSVTAGRPELAFYLRIPGIIITSYVNLDTAAEPEHGGLEVIPMRNGSLLIQAHSCGSMEKKNVSIPHRILFL